MGPGTPRRRGLRQLIGIAAGVATMSVAAGAAAAGGGGIVPPDPQLRDFGCVEKCAGLKVATAGSRIAFTGVDLQAITGVEFAAAGGGRTNPVAAAATSSRVEARVPPGAATGFVVLTGGGATLRTAERARDRQRRRDPRQRRLQAQLRRGGPAEDVLRRPPGAERLLPLPGARADRRPGRGDQP